MMKKRYGICDAKKEEEEKKKEFIMPSSLKEKLQR